MKTFEYLLEVREKKGAGFLLLLDPDKLAHENLRDVVQHAQESGVDAFLVGSSLMTRDIFEDALKQIKRDAKIPVVIFPGSLFQISSHADAILFLSVLASRNIDLIVGNHVHAAPLIRQHRLETISTAYLLVESGKMTSAHFMSDSFPIPREKPEIAAAYSMAAEMFGMKMVYLEAGSGALSCVPKEMVQMVAKSVNMPVTVGGGIKNPEIAYELANAGAAFVVTGNFFEDNGNSDKLKEFARAVHFKQRKGVVV
ncbi:MAG TPA: geranylgeranylglyceryl/heptaprenylglyceryl phosphate synthase [Candidatus Acidoferrales bacterium]|nr:geranylgeranylglyceryl/heptaprenylglyceryl phosphate synthase [Candidatus Acidoferrales bacterium]